MTDATGADAADAPDLESLLGQLTDAEVFTHWATTMRELRRRGLIRTDKSPLGDFAEWLVAREYGVALEEGAANTGLDLRKRDGTRVQVKARKHTATGYTGLPARHPRSAEREVLLEQNANEFVEPVLAELADVAIVAGRRDRRARRRQVSAQHGQAP